MGTALVMGTAVIGTVRPCRGWGCLWSLLQSHGFVQKDPARRETRGGCKQTPGTWQLPHGVPLAISTARLARWVAVGGRKD